MNYKNIDPIYNNNDNDSFENSNDIFYINNNPINKYHNSDLSDNNSYYNIRNKKNKCKNTKINLNNPKLLEAYNEGYYGVNNIPKQYYIYPKFSNIENNKKQKEVTKQNVNPSIENNIFNKNMNKIEEKNYDIIYNKTFSKNNNLSDNNYNNINNVNNNINSLNNNNFASLYANYPYPYLKLINISSNLFGQFHSPNSNLNSKMINNNTNNGIIEKENQDENNLYNKTFDISLKIKDNKKIKIKGSGKIMDVLPKEKEKNESIIENEDENKINNNDEDLNDSGNFYYINNNVTKRNIPYKNNPDNISIDDQEEED